MAPYLPCLGSLPPSASAPWPPSPPSREPASAADLGGGQDKSSCTSLPASPTGRRGGQTGNRPEYQVATEHSKGLRGSGHCTHLSPIAEEVLENFFGCIFVIQHSSVKCGNLFSHQAHLHGLPCRGQEPAPPSSSPPCACKLSRLAVHQGRGILDLLKFRSTFST